MKLKTYNSIGEYDKTNNLVKYIEFTEDLQHVKCYYKVDGNLLDRTFLQDYRAEEPPYTEVLNSVVEYSDNVMLFSLRLDGETYLEPVLSGQSYSSGNRPAIVNTFFSCQPEHHNNASVESFSIKPNLINDYLNKL